MAVRVKTTPLFVETSFTIFRPLVVSVAVEETERPQPAASSAANKNMENGGFMHAA
jgi:hypothetical protein